MTLSLLYYSFRELPLGDATTIIFSSPVIVIALSFFFLKEPCGVLRVVVVCTLFMGVVLVARPPFIFQVIKSKKKENTKINNFYFDNIQSKFIQQTNKKSVINVLKITLPCREFQNYAKSIFNEMASFLGNMQ